MTSKAVEMKRDRIFVAGARGMVGGAICRALDKNGYHNVLAPGRDTLVPGRLGCGEFVA